MTASRRGEPFEATCRAKAMLPNIAMRFCTTQLKVEPVRWWVTRDLCWPKVYYSILGIRADEPKRFGKATLEQCKSLYPLVFDDVTEETVLDYWRRSPFDLGIPSEQGNCDLCFLKGKGKLIRLTRQEPERAAWWINMEREFLKTSNRKVKLKKYGGPEIARFRLQYSYADVLAWAQELDVDTGEAEEPSIDCFCGD